MAIDIVEVLKTIRPNSEFTIENGDYSTIQWHVLEGKAPTKAEIESAKSKMEADLSAKELEAAAAKQSILDRLGITAEEAKLILL